MNTVCVGSAKGGTPNTKGFPSGRAGVIGDLQVYRLGRRAQRGCLDIAGIVLDAMVGIE